MAFQEVDPGPMPEGKFWKPKDIGEKFMGFFVSKAQRTVTFSDGPKTLTDWTFRNRDGVFTLNPNADLSRRLEAAHLEPGHAVRITYVANVDTGKADPMKQFRLEVDRELKPPANYGPPPAAQPQRQAAPPPPARREPPPPFDDDIPF